MPIETAANDKSSLIATLGFLAGWAWAIAAGGGGIWYLYTEGPWRLTNGWFALASGIAACPLTATVLRRYFGLRISGWVQFGLAALLFIAGKIALSAGI